MRTIVWVGLAILGLNLLLVGALAFSGMIRRFQIWRTRRELERLGFLVQLPSAPAPQPMWPRWAAAVAALVILLVTTSVITRSPSGRTLASTGGSPVEAAGTHGAVGPPVENSGSEHAITHEAPASPGIVSSQGPVSSSVPPVAEAGSDAGAPSAVAAVPTSATAIRLDWAPVPDASRYDIERSTDSVVWRPVGSTDGGTTAFIDSTLTSATTYYYRVTAIIDGQDESLSDAVSATTAVDTSIPPVLISATGSDTSIALDWSSVDGATGYKIERWTDASNEWTQIGTTGQDVTEYTNNGLAAATSFSYRVVAMTPDGDSVPSAVLSATTTATEASTSGTTGTTTSSDPTDPKDPSQ